MSSCQNQFQFLITILCFILNCFISTFLHFYSSFFCLFIFLAHFCFLVTLISFMFLSTRFGSFPPVILKRLPLARLSMFCNFSICCHLGLYRFILMDSLSLPRTEGKLLSVSSMVRKPVTVAV